MPLVVYVVPCFNESKRIDRAAFEQLLELPAIRLCFVDDGSTDDTRAILARFRDAHPSRVSFLALPSNRGKGEAVRAGLADALATGASWVGFADADLATPPSELRRLAERALASHADVVMGSRIARAGAHIDRRPVRHYLGRVFATYASVLLDARMYDTQCGAKLFRAGPRLARALATPFASGWVFDVELLGRLLFDPREPMPEGAVLEVPLDRWSDVAGSHIRPSAIPRIARDVARVSLDVTRARRAAGARRGSGRRDESDA